ncbi:HlyC/CorC family transporter [Rhodococcus sp. 05-339-2]|uniref:hemolysin family protein n=1 Tax=Rhodococcoides fascians TaxID=1828 RepID=UPI00050C31A2|nr:MULTISPECIES: hemolysin family protein [Rhodococcus]OZD85494.1 HlyC/CorC family transporter [Rhodococcus sp. 05-339-2]
MSVVLTLLLGLLVVFLITVATGYFVAQEFAYMTVDRSRLKARAEAGDAVAARTLTVTKRTSFMLSGAQLGITVTGLLVGYVAEPLIGQSFGAILGGVGVPTAVGVGLGAVLAITFATFVQMLFGELFPKNFAIARPEPVARWLSLSTTIYLKLFGWLITIFDQSSNLLLKALKIEPVHDVEHSASLRDLEHIVSDSRETGDLPDELSTLLDRILDFPTRTVEHAMIPRSRSATVRDTDTLAEVAALMGQEHSRYPVLDEDDGIVGVVHLADVLSATVPESTPISELTRDALILPEIQSLPDAMRELRSTKNQLACVIDEYGGLTGVITIEDLAEELVGEITDEHDDDLSDPSPVSADDGSWTMAGEVHVDEVERAIGIDLPEGDYETIAGFAIAHNGSLPDVGERIEVDLPPDNADLANDEESPVRFVILEIEEIDSHVPSLLTLTLGERDPEHDDESAETKESVHR